MSAQLWQLETLLLQKDTYVNYSRQLSTTSIGWSQNLGSFRPQNLLRRTVCKLQSLIIENWQRGWILVLWVVAMASIFAWKFWQYRNRAAFRVMGYCLATAKGAAETLKLNMALILLPVCRNTLTWLRSTKARSFVPFDDNINFHKVRVVTTQLSDIYKPFPLKTCIIEFLHKIILNKLRFFVCFFIIIIGTQLPICNYLPLISQMIACAIAIGICIHAGNHLACDFPRLTQSSPEKFAMISSEFNGKKPTYKDLLIGVEGVTGISMVILMVIAFTLASRYFRRNVVKLPSPFNRLTGFNAFWYSHHILGLVYVLLLIHGTFLFLAHKWYQRTVRTLNHNLF